MPIRPGLQQLEKCIDDALRKNDFRPLQTLSEIDVCEDVVIKCSKRFFHKLDGLICRELVKKDIQTVSTILISVGRCSKNISILGQAGLPVMIKQGLVQKMAAWFEKFNEIILNRGNAEDDTAINMIDDFFDVLMVIHNVNDEGQRQTLESFAPRFCALVIDSRVNIYIQREALRKMNTMLDKMTEDSRKMFFSQEMLILMSSMGERILDVGDYDLQCAIVEALCRITTNKERHVLASQWFSMDFIVHAFKRIKDYQFETDCRKFLNFVNGMLGDKRRVFTFPCLSAFLDKYELQMPSDEKLEEFWIDFNLGSETLSFYIAGDNNDRRWEAVSVPEETVQLYSIEVRESKKLLTIILKNIIKISKRDGKELLLYFDASLEITAVTQKMFGVNKYREFTPKQTLSIAKTSVHVLFDESGSQILVPESQLSSVTEELVNFSEKPSPQREFANPPNYVENNHEARKNNHVHVITPRKRKISEASMVVPGADRYTSRSPVLLTNTSTQRRGRIKPPLQMRSSAETPGVSKPSENGVNNAVPQKSKPSEERDGGNNTHQHMKTANDVERTESEDNEFPNQNFTEFQDTAPDSQAVVKKDKPVLPGVLQNICENKTQSKWACWTPVTNIQLCNNRRVNYSSKTTLNPDLVAHKECTKEKLSSSLSGNNSEETGKVQTTQEIVLNNKADNVEADICERSHQQELSHPKHLEETSTEHTKQSDWRVESETTFKSVLLNKTVEESLIYRKKYIVSKDVKTAVCDKNSSPGKTVESHRKPETKLTSDVNSCDLKQKNLRENSREKGFTDAAQSLISPINKRYKAKDDRKSVRKLKEPMVDSGFSNRSDVHLSKEKVQKKSFRQLKTTLVNVTSECPLNDVYNFNLNGADEPTIKLGIQEFQATSTKACMDNSVNLVDSRNQDELEPSLKTKDKRIMTDKKKHLFSDNETDNRFDDSKTDISWLREPKSKPQLIDYSRQKHVKKHQSGRRRSSLEMEQEIPSKNIIRKVDETVSDGRPRLPRRAAKTKINYKDLSNSESESETEFSHTSKEKLLTKEENIHSRSKTMKQPKKPQNAFPAETPVGLPEGWEKSSIQEDTTKNRSSLEVSPSSGSPLSIEVMRAKSVSTSEKHSSLELNSNSGVESPVKSPESSEKNVLYTRETCSPHLISPSYTPATSNNTVVNRKSMEVPQEMQNSSSYNLEQEFLESELLNIIGSHIQRKKDVSPTWHPNRKGMYIEDDVSNSDEVETDEEEERRVNLFPKKRSKLEDTHYKRVDHFTKQSWKSVEQHMTTMNHQIQEYRNEKLDKFQFTIIQELENFERESQSLKVLEKEFMGFWEKIFQKFIDYQKSEQQRLHLLRSSYDKNVLHNTKHDESIFTSEMCSMKENTRRLQEQLLNEMLQNPYYSEN
ncbi:PREDICTED: synaptonemal complex protein 2 [Chrysochloris asiatica]|uniref:Synaptonemal complex protein 2 n=1 Tax=Chrysochloris asiatica TaxID=185453 RepID=A0A9B0TBL6_CHRAS|nr:PREDICTED: synaptonemal complex protein 2 [Chrysochloris asiatica]